MASRPHPRRPGPPRVPFRVVIPARYGATRLPGKPLRPLGGRPLLEHVHRRAAASGAEEVVVATDHPEVQRVAEGFGARALLTSPGHASGTERLAEVVERLGWPPDTVVVNLQGDEPFMPPELLAQVAADLAEHPQAPVATLCAPIATAAELFDPHVVKVVRDAAGYALYFSRAPIPWDREAFGGTEERLPPGSVHHRHIGLYAYRAGFLARYVAWPPCPPERLEALEQLRVLWHGERIHVALAERPAPPGVDTEEDLARAERLLQDLLREQGPG